MISDLERRFFAEELDESTRSLLLSEIERRKSGRVEFRFNVVDVVMDFDAHVVTLSGILVSEGEVDLPIEYFVARLRST